jgi:pectin-derived oligosaccharide transport system substrate-binding protein
MKGIRTRRIFAVVAAVAATVGLAACASSAPSAPHTLSSKPVTLNLTYWGSDARVQNTDKVIAAFEKKYPNITVKGQFKDWAGYWDSLATSTAANDAPDVIQMDELYLSSYAGRGALLDLSTQNDFVSTKNYSKEVLATGQIDGTQYALPATYGAYSIIVNDDILKKYNIPMPDDKTWTWDDLATISEQITKASGGEVAGFQGWGFDAAGPNIWARQNGGSLYNSKGDVAIKPAVLASYWQYILDLTDKGATAPASTIIERQSAGLTGSGMATNKVAFAPFWATQLTSLAAASGQHLSILQIPGEAKADDPGLYFKPGMYWTVSARSKHPAEAAAFANFISNNNDAGKINGTERGIPSNSAVRAAITPDLSATDKAAVEYLDGIKVGPAPLVTPAGASSIETILARYTQQVLFKQATPKQAAAAFIKELQGEIDAAK